jgi:hypothetical protein
MYIKDNLYPYSPEQLRKDNSQVSFPLVIPESLLNEYGVYKVQPTPMPIVPYGKNVKEEMPQLVNGAWTQVWSVTDATAEEKLARVLQLRKNEYPPMSEYLDGIVKGDVAQVEKYINDCLAVKAKYPKP